VSNIILNTHTHTHTHTHTARGIITRVKISKISLYSNPFHNLFINVLRRPDGACSVYVRSVKTCIQPEKSRNHFINPEIYINYGEIKKQRDNARTERQDWRAADFSTNIILKTPKNTPENAKSVSTESVQDQYKIPLMKTGTISIAD
jgi:hypothetical protein